MISEADQLKELLGLTVNMDNLRGPGEEGDDNLVANKQTGNDPKNIQMVAMTNGQAHLTLTEHGNDPRKQGQGTEGTWPPNFLVDVKMKDEEFNKKYVKDEFDIDRLNNKKGDDNNTKRAAAKDSHSEDDEDNNPFMQSDEK